MREISSLSQFRASFLLHEGTGDRQADTLQMIDALITRFVEYREAALRRESGAINDLGSGEHPAIVPPGTKAIG